MFKVSQHVGSGKTAPGKIGCKNRHASTASRAAFPSVSLFAVTLVRSRAKIVK